MKVAIVSRMKHGFLFEWLLEHKYTQTRLAIETGINPCLIGEIINLKRVPTKAQMESITSVVGITSDVLFPEAHSSLVEAYGGMTDVRFREYDIEMLSYESPEVKVIEYTPDSEPSELVEGMEKILYTLAPREEKIIRMRFGFDPYCNEHTLDQMAEEMEYSKERVRQILLKALRKLRHPSRAKKLKAFV